MFPRILTYEDRFGARTLAEHALRNPGVAGDTTLPTGRVAVGPVVIARVNHGRWIGDCPDFACGGAEFVSFENPVFFCCACRNAMVGSDYLPVDEPGPGVRQEIEAYLRARPQPQSRNWHPGETVAQLRDENRVKKLLLLPEDR